MTARVYAKCFENYPAGSLSLFAFAGAFFLTPAPVAVILSTSDSQTSLGKHMFYRITETDGSSLTFGLPGAAHA